MPTPATQFPRCLGQTRRKHLTAEGLGLFMWKHLRFYATLSIIILLPLGVEMEILIREIEERDYPTFCCYGTTSLATIISPLKILFRTTTDLEQTD